jgi:Immunity protein 21
MIARRANPLEGSTLARPNKLIAEMKHLNLASRVFVVAMLAGCEQQTGSAPQTNSQKVAGMSDFDYLACDGGPHLVLPKEFGNQWMGAGSTETALNRSSDYGRACAAVTSQHMALIPIGSGQAMVLADPPLSAWGRSPEGWIDIYYLEAWSDTNTDGLLKRAVAATPTSSMSDNGMTLILNEAGAVSGC